MRNKVGKSIVLCLSSLLLLVVSCREPSPDMDEYDLEDQRLIEFYFNDDDNASLDGKYKAIFEGSIVYISVPDGTDRSSLIPRFKARGKGMQVDGAWQSSGSSVQDFTSAVIYDLVKTDGSRIQYSVVVGYGDLSGNQLYEFGFTVSDNSGNLWENVTGIQDGNDLTFYFPYGTTMIDFVPSFTVPAGAEVRYNGLPLTSNAGPPFVNPGEGGTLSVIFSDGSSKGFSIHAAIKSREAIYVQDGAAGVLGTQQDPLGDIAAAYSLAKSEGILEIRIAEGNYTLATQLVIDSNIKIKGGYYDDGSNVNWSDRAYLTPWDRSDGTHSVIIDCTDGTAGAAMDFYGGILFTGSSVNESTLLEGVNVTRSAAGDYSSAVTVEDGASPLIRFTDLYGPNASSGAAVFISNASPGLYSGMLKGNASGNISFGLSVYGSSSDPEVVSCLITSTDGSFPPQGYGLDLDGSAGGIYSNNFFESQAGTDSSAVRLMSGGGEFYNNIFSLVPGGTNDVHFKENSSGANPDVLKNNVFSNDNGGGDVLYRSEGSLDLTTTSGINSLSYSEISDNRAYLFSSSSQYESDASSGTIPPAVALKGTVPGISWLKDFYGNDRSADGSSGWSIGSIEVDSCYYDAQYLGFNAGADGSYDGNWSSLSISEAVLLANDWGKTETVYEDAGGGYTISGMPEMQISSDLNIVCENLATVLWPSAGLSVFVIDDNDSGNEIDVFIRGFEFFDGTRPGLNGGAIVSRENTYIYDCVFEDNEADGGGSIYQEGGALYLGSTVFYWSSALSGPGAGVYVKDGFFHGFNLMFWGNDATGGDGSAAYFDNSEAYIINSDFLSNATSDEAAVYADGGVLYVLNSIFCDNSAGVGLADVNISAGTLSLYGSIVQSAAYTGWTNVTQTLTAAGIGFLDSIAPFVDTGWDVDGNDYHASTNGEAMVDHGISDYIPRDWPDADGDGNTSEDYPYDLAGTPRQEGSSIDAGCYESY